MATRLPQRRQGLPGRVTCAHLSVFLGLGFLLGLCGGSMLMGTMHALLMQGSSSSSSSSWDGKLPVSQAASRVAKKAAEQQQIPNAVLNEPMRWGEAGGKQQAGEASQAASGKQQAGEASQAASGKQQQQQQQQQQQRQEAASQGGQQQQQQQQRQQQRQQPQDQQMQPWQENTQLVDTTIHTLCPSNGSPYQNYQMRIAYATYKLVQAMPGGERHAAFTRILHRSTPDALMGEVPTFRADPVQPKCDDWCEYPVADRANAVRQFLDAARADPSLIEAPWLYMIESDYVFMKPLQLPVEAGPEVDGWAFRFQYIQPRAHREAMHKLYPKAVGKPKDIPGTGPAPVLLRREHWEKLTPEWERLAALIEADADLKQELGWVREMYGFAAAVALSRIKLELMRGPTTNPFISQLPIDHLLGAAHAFHYTQCTIYQGAADGSDIWKFDKRFFTREDDYLNIQPIPMPPPFSAGEWKFIEGNPVTLDVHQAIEQMVAQMNRGIATLGLLQPAAAS